MPNINIDSIKDRTFDAIVIGSGISGGWAAKELCEKGLKTLVLERGREVKHITDYPTTNMMPWEFEHRNQLTREMKEANPIAARCYAFYEGTEHFFVKDDEHPYIQEKPFDWLRGYQTGGKSLLWARQTQRWSDFDFEGPARDGFAVDWPIRYADIAPWYSYVERFAGISGNRDGLKNLPDGDFLPAHEMNCVESYFQEQIKKNYKDRHIIQGRCAHLTDNRQIFLDQSRSKCMHRTICERGCPYGGYFSSNSSTLPAAAKTGNMTLRPYSVVHSIIYDEKLGKASGVKVIDTQTKEEIDFFAKVIFLNAAALNSNLVLMNSKSSRFPNGLGNDSGVLGKYVAFHNYNRTISGEYEGYLDKTTEGRRPNSPYVPRFRNVEKQETDFLRGYAAGFQASRGPRFSGEGWGEELKNGLDTSKYNDYWSVGSHMMGETIPKESNHVALDSAQKDAWGIPLLRIAIDYDENDKKMEKDYEEQFTEMFEKAGFKNIKTHESGRNPGNDIHEMGGVRMGHDPKTSMLDKWHALHHCQNVFVTDGACMTSTSTQNPSLTYMAFAARAVDYAVNRMKRGEL